MQQSSVIQYYSEKAERKANIENILNVLDVRFQPNDVQMLKPALENIEELQSLKQLLREAVQVPNLDEFKRILAS